MDIYLKKIFLLFLDCGSRLISRQPRRKRSTAKYPRLYGPGLEEGLSLVTEVLNVGLCDGKIP